MIRALIRDDDPAFLGRPRHGDLPDVWDDSLTHEIALALAVSAAVGGARRPGRRGSWAPACPGVELLLRDGTLDLPRARLVTEVFADLSDEDCARAEELLLPRLTEPPRKTYTQVERIATAIAAEVDPDLAERRRKAAEKHRSRVTMFREPAGTAAACRAGTCRPTRRWPRSPRRPPAPGCTRTPARSRASGWTACGRRPTWTSSTASRPTTGSPTGGSAPTTAPDDGPDAADDGRRRPTTARPATAPGDGSSGGGPGPGGSDCPCDECDGRCAPPDDSDFPTTTDDDPATTSRATATPAMTARQRRRPGDRRPARRRRAARPGGPGGDAGRRPAATRGPPGGDAGSAPPGTAIAAPAARPTARRRR